MRILKIDCCKNCPFANYIATDYYRNAYYKCDKTSRDISENVYNGGIHESCVLENEQLNTLFITSMDKDTTENKEDDN